MKSKHFPHPVGVHSNPYYWYVWQWFIFVVLGHLHIIFILKTNFYRFFASLVGTMIFFAMEETCLNTSMNSSHEKKLNHQVHSSIYKSEIRNWYFLYSVNVLCWRHRHSWKWVSDVFQEQWMNQIWHLLVSLKRKWNFTWVLPIYICKY